MTRYLCSLNDFTFFCNKERKKCRNKKSYDYCHKSLRIHSVHKKFKHIMTFKKVSAAMSVCLFVRERNCMDSFLNAN